MSVSLGDAVLFLRANSDNLNKGLSDAEAKTKGWASSIGGSVGKLVGGAVVGGAVLAAGAIVGIGTAAFSVSQEIDTATKKMQSMLGITADEAQKLRDIAVGVFKNNFAGSITEAAEAVGLVKQQLGLLVDEDELQGITKNAFRLKDAFGTDVTESVSAAKTLMENFGISSDKAFDLVTAGFQSGLDRSGDFLDTINEYSTQFASGGASAEQFFGLLQSGLGGGMLGTDKAADAFKEFRVRLQDFSDTTLQALTGLGFDAEKVYDDLADGTVSTAQVFDQVITALNNTDDANLRMLYGVGLLGTQFEDLGDSALSLELIPDYFEDIAGATAGLDVQYNTLGAAFEGFKRQALVALQPLGDELLKIANEVMPHVSAGFAWLSDKLPGIISGAVGFVREGVAFIQKLFASDLKEGLDSGLSRFQFVKDWIDENMPLIRQTIQTILTAIATFWRNHGDTIMSVVQRTFDTVMLVVDTILKSVLGIIRAVMLAINGDWEGAWNEVANVVGRILSTILTVVGNQMLSMVQLIVSIGPSLIGAGRALIENMWTGMSTGFTVLFSRARAKLQELRNLLPFSEPRDSTSPLRGLAKSGEAIVGQIQQGLDRASLNLNGMLSTPTAAGATYGNMTVNVYGATDPTSTARAVDNVLNTRRRRGI
jgi:TP901 family phage tail tape measure protein